MFPILERLIYGAEPMWALNGTKLAFIGVCNVDGKVLAGASCVQDKFAWSGLYTVLLAGAALMGALTAAIARGELWLHMNAC